jgi:hypothetical protein
MKKKKKRMPARRNPVAKALRTLKPKTEPTAKAYRRKPKHKGHPETDDRDSLRPLPTESRLRPTEGRHFSRLARGR